MIKSGFIHSRVQPSIWFKYFFKRHHFDRDGFMKVQLPKVGRKFS